MKAAFHGPLPAGGGREARADLGIGIGLALIHLGALAAFVPFFFSWSGLIVCAVLFYLTGGIGVCLGYHRILTHRSLRVPKWLEYAIVTCGAFALQGGPITWIGTHRAHHTYSDTERDPHSARKGFWWCHVLWLFAPNAARPKEDVLRRLTPDLSNDRYYCFLEKNHAWLQLALGFALLAAGGWSWLVWGGFVRLVLLYHATWSVNSAAHGWGYRSWGAGDVSTNNWFVALVSWGEGWHNNHHAFPFSARHGLRWYELDLTWLTIQGLEKLGLATKVRVPSPAMLLRGPAPRSVAV
jgi:stearoyl-CoA desaturase (delta-9 desaturase)